MGCSRSLGEWGGDNGLRISLMKFVLFSFIRKGISFSFEGAYFPRLNIFQNIEKNYNYLISVSVQIQ